MNNDVDIDYEEEYYEMKNRVTCLELDCEILRKKYDQLRKENEKSYLQGFKDSEEKYSTVIADNMKKDEIINKAINEIESLREYFSEDLQPDFIRILEILKDKKVIDW